MCPLVGRLRKIIRSAASDPGTARNLTWKLTGVMKTLVMGHLGLDVAAHDIARELCCSLECVKDMQAFGVIQTDKTEAAYQSMYDGIYKLGRAVLGNNSW